MADTTYISPPEPLLTSNVIARIQTLLKEPDPSASFSIGIDFLNNFFSSIDDLAKAATLLDDYQRRQRELEKQHARIQENTQTIIKNSLDRSQAIKTKLENLRFTKLECKDQLVDLCQTLVSDTKTSSGERNNTLLERLEHLRLQVVDLERTRNYLILIKNAEDKAHQAKEVVKGDVPTSLSLYRQICDLYRSMAMKNAQIGYSATFITKYYKEISINVAEHIKSHLSRTFEETLPKLDWPLPIRQPIPDDKVNELVHFAEAFENLLLYQHAVNEEEEAMLDFDEKRGLAVKRRNPGEQLPIIYAMQLLVKPLIFRFRYHFDSDKETNRLDRPEWYFAHVISAIKDHSPFLQGDIQRIFNKHGFRNYNARNEFTRCYLAVVEKKIVTSFPDLAVNPQLLSHTIHECILFDETLKNLQYSPPGISPSNWRGCVDIILGRKDRFKTWIDVEKEFAMSRFHDLLNSNEVWQSDPSNAVGDLVPTKSAVFVKDLVESITDRYRPLPRFHQKVRFLLDIQIDLLASYHRRISAGLDAFETLTSSLIRAVPGVHQAEGRATVGVEALKRLCLLYNSSAYMSKICRDWGESEFFIDLWHEVTQRATENAKRQLKADKKRPLSVSSVDEVIAEVRSQSTMGNFENGDEGLLFDEIIGLFDNTTKRVQHLLVGHICKEMNTLLKPYTRVRRWGQNDPLAFIDGNEGKDAVNEAENIADSSFFADTDISISPELYAPLTHISQCLNFLSANLPARSYAEVYRLLARDLETFLYNKVVMGAQVSVGGPAAPFLKSGSSNGVFSVEGGIQFAIDMIEGLWRTVTSSSGIANSKTFLSHPESAFRKLRDAVILLSLPTSVDTSMAKLDLIKKYLNVSPISFAQVRAVISEREKSNLDIKSYLESLGVYTLNREQAKEILQRRIDFWR